ILERRGHDVLGHVVQPVRQFAAPRRPPRGEELVSSPTEQLRLGAQRLVEQDLGRLVATTLADTTDPAAAPEPLRTGRVLDDSVECDVLADDDPSHLGSMLRRKSVAEQCRVRERPYASTFRALVEHAFGLPRSPTDAKLCAL